MMEDTSNVNPKNRRRGNKRLNKISFDSETVTKSEAELLKNVAKSNYDDVQNTNQKKVNGLKQNKRARGTEDKKDVIGNANKETKKPTRRSKKRNKTEGNVKESEETAKSSDETKRKRKKSETEDGDEEESVAETETVKSGKSSGDKKESKRSLKRKKFEELVKNRKQQSEDLVSKSCLEYLSNYKYNRDNWKFEKLKQIWLIENLFDEERIDNKSWDIVVDYFENSKGGVRKILIDKALKIIEEGDSEEKEESEGEEKDEAVEKVSQVKIDRARKLIQSLQE